jgi:hypothetical protein
VIDLPAASPSADGCRREHKPPKNPEDNQPSFHMAPPENRASKSLFLSFPSNILHYDKNMA